jgi:hypothetical protein
MKTLRNAAFCAAMTVAASATAQTESVQHYVDAQGHDVTVTSGQPAPPHYGPRPSFEQLDRNHDGRITRDEAEMFTPLANDFDYLTHGGSAITAQQYARWDYH